MIIAIDGPAGAGKSSVARRVAAVLGYRFLDTGAMYRAVALAVLDRGLSVNDDGAIGRLAGELDIRVDDSRVMLEGRDVGERIRDSDVTEIVSHVAAIAAVRASMADRQRAEARDADVVIEGRDIGTTIAPDAPVKVFLTASAEERARRRILQLGRRPDARSVRSMAASIAARDRADSARSESPLVRPADALVVDSTHMSFDEVVEETLRAVKAAANSEGAS